MARTSATALQRSERLTRALALRRQGRTLEEIGTDLDVTAQAVHGLLKRELERLARQRKEDNDVLVELELQRLDELQAVHWLKATGRHFQPQQPTAEVKEGEEGKPVPAADGQERTALFADVKSAELVLKIMARRAKLLGLDKPTEKERSPGSSPLDVMSPAELLTLADRLGLDVSIEVRQALTISQPVQPCRPLPTSGSN